MSDAVARIAERARVVGAAAEHGTFGGAYSTSARIGRKVHQTRGNALAGRAAERIASIARGTRRAVRVVRGTVQRRWVKMSEA